MEQEDEDLEDDDEEREKRRQRRIAEQQQRAQQNDSADTQMDSVVPVKPIMPPTINIVATSTDNLNDHTPGVGNVPQMPSNLSLCTSINSQYGEGGAKRAASFANRDKVERFRKSFLDDDGADDGNHAVAAIPYAPSQDSMCPSIVGGGVLNMKELHQASPSPEPGGFITAASSAANSAISSRRSSRVTADQVNKFRNQEFGAPMPNQVIEKSDKNTHHRHSDAPAATQMRRASLEPPNKGSPKKKR